jgi:MoxR-like ATPase
MLSQGKREELSQSFLGRFVPLVFDEFPPHEWKEIVARRLQEGLPGDQAARISQALSIVANQLVDFHTAFKDMIRSPSRPFQEQQPYAAVSIRELLQVVEHLRRLLACPGQFIINQSPGETSKAIAFEVWCTYGSRFRLASSRDAVRQLIESTWNTTLEACLLERCSLDERGIALGRVALPFDGRSLPSSGTFIVTEAALKAVRTRGVGNVPVGDTGLWAYGYLTDQHTIQIVDAIRRCRQLLSSFDFLAKYGVYPGMGAWHTTWMQHASVLADRDSAMPVETLAAIGACCYADRLRHPEARRHVLAIFASVFRTREDALEARMAALGKGPEALQLQPERPLAVTQRVLDVWVQILRAARVQLPILVVGPAGCGKSTAIAALAELVHAPFLQAYLTAETDASLLVGGYRPSARGEAADAGAGEKLIDWQDGIITEAIRRAGWVLLDNISDADPCVLERLNPLLEQNPHWVLTEKGDVGVMEATDPNKKPTFRVLAAMSVGGSRGTRNKELSPALSNRFNAVYMPGLPADAVKRQECEMEFYVVARALLGLDDEGSLKVAAACWLLWSRLLTPAGAAKHPDLVEPFTFRSVVRFLDSAFRQRQVVPGASWGSCLLSAFQLSVAGQFSQEKKGPEKLAELTTDLARELQRLWREEPRGNILELNVAEDPSHVLTAQRRVYAERLYAASICNFPVLLEGPAAVGKTSLVDMLARNWRVGGEVRPRTLERVNNTQTTTIQDYFGSYIPVGARFEFQPGALYRALERGDWFLADEFNLADPNIMSMLAPLLEGASQIAIPGTSFEVAVDPSFRFFATQNDASKYQGRNQLPPTLRSRLVEVQVGDFAEAPPGAPPQSAELCQILTRRERERGMAPDTAAKLAVVYSRLGRTPSLRITMRELIKWSRRRASFFPAGGHAQAQLQDNRAWFLAGHSLLYPRAATATAGETVAGILQETFGERPPAATTTFEGVQGRIQLRTGDITQQVPQPNSWAALSRHRPMPPSFEVALARLLLAVQNREPVLLVGPTACKSHAIRVVLEVLERSAEWCYLSPETEALDLVGQMTPYTPLAALKDVHATFARILTRLEARQGERGLEERPDANPAYQRVYTTVRRLHYAIEAYRAASQDAADQNKAEAAKKREEEAQADDNAAFVPEELEGPELEAHHDEPDAFEVDKPDDSDILDDMDVDEIFGLLQPAVSAAADEEDMESEEEVVLFGLDPDSGPTGFEDSGDEAPPAERTSGPTGFEDSDDDAKPSKPSAPTGFEDSDDDAKPSSPSAPTGFEDSDDEALPPPPPPPKATGAPGFEDSDDDATPPPTPPSSAASGRSARGPAGFEDSDDDAEEAHKASASAGEDQGAAAANAPKADAPGQPAGTTAAALRQLLDQVKQAQDPQLSAPLEECLKLIKEIRLGIQGLCSPTSRFPDAVALQLLIRVDQFTKYVDKTLKAGRSDPMFAFREGPVSRTVTEGGLLVLEDFNLPNQAVTERLNSLFEPDRSFTLTEDIARSSPPTGSGAAGQAILVPARFQVIATVHRDNPEAPLHISPATRSRFTEICIPKYSDGDMALLLRVVLGRRLADPEAERIAGVLLWLWNHMDDVNGGLPGGGAPGGAVTLTQLIKVCDYITENPREKPTLRLLVGARFLLLDQVRPKIGLRKAVEWNEAVGLQAPREFLKRLFLDPPADVLADPLRLTHDEVPRITCRYGDVSERVIGEAPPADKVQERFGMQFTATTVKNVARIFVSGAAGAPLLMVGPPGIGKTAIVCAVAQLLGQRVERINFSANTSIDQLFGSIVPCVIGGQRVFSWQDGRLLTALRSGHWVLFDEMNLAPPEVLEALVPLLRRDTNRLPVPGSDLVIELKGVRVFATMNPVSTGGGRSKLPRSIQSLFTSVLLDGYNDLEMLQILGRCFARLIDMPESGGSDWGVVTKDQLQIIFNLHSEFQRLVAQKELGRVGGPYEFNLRDLMKLRDVLAGNAGNLRDHYRFYNKTAEQMSGSGESANDRLKRDEDVRTLALHKFMQLVYARRFHSEQDRRRAVALIGEPQFLPVGESLQVLAKEEIDTSIPDMVRIGTVYLDVGTRADTTGASTLHGFIHTAHTIAQLESIAAAVQAERAVLLEGDTCSGKTSIIRELARLCQRELVVLSMNHETETSDLIGQWLPTEPSVQEAIEIRGVMTFLGAAMRTCLIRILPLLSKLLEEKQQPVDAFTLAVRTVEESIRLSLAATGKAAPAPDRPGLSVEAVEATRAAFDTLGSAVLGCLAIPGLPRVIEEECRALAAKRARLAPAVESMVKQLAAGRTESRRGIVFTWVESPLVRAIREGAWVLLDNVNSAPQEVIERLNSLFEDDPTLNLIETGETKPLTREDGTIHHNFRIFATSNSNRKNSNKLSGAFLNRVIRVWLPALDAGLERLENVQEHDTFTILVAKLPSIPGASKLAELILRVHAACMVKSREKRINLVGNIQVTFRTVLRAVRSAGLLISRGVPPARAVVWSLVRNYANSCKTKAESGLVLRDILGLLEDTRVLNAVMPASVGASRSGDARAQLEGEKRTLSLVLANVETLLLRAVGLLALSLGSREGAVAVARLMLQSRLAREYDPAKVEAVLAAAHTGSVGPEACFGALRVVNVPADAGAAAITQMLKDAVQQLQRSAKPCTEALVRFAFNASFLDAPERCALLRRVTTVRNKFQVLLSHDLWHEQPEGTRQLLASCQAVVASLEVAELSGDWLALLADGSLRELYGRCTRVLGEKKSLFYVIKRDLSRPLLSSRASLFQVLEVLIDDSRSPELRSFSLSLFWAAHSLDEASRLVHQAPLVLEQEPPVSVAELFRLEIRTNLSLLQRALVTLPSLQGLHHKIKEAVEAFAMCQEHSTQQEEQLKRAKEALARQQAKVAKLQQARDSALSRLGTTPVDLNDPDSVEQAAGLGEGESKAVQEAKTKHILLQDEVTRLCDREDTVREVERLIQEAGHLSRQMSQDHIPSMKRLQADVHQVFTGQHLWPAIARSFQATAANRVAAFITAWAALSSEAKGAFRDSRGWLTAVPTGRALTALRSVSQYGLQLDLFKIATCLAFTPALPAADFAAVDAATDPGAVLALVSRLRGLVVVFLYTTTASEGLVSCLLVSVAGDVSVRRVQAMHLTSDRVAARGPLLERCVERLHEAMSRRFPRAEISFSRRELTDTYAEQGFLAESLITALTRIRAADGGGGVELGPPDASGDLIERVKALHESVSQQLASTEAFVVKNSGPLEGEDISAFSALERFSHPSTEITSDPAALQILSEKLSQLYFFLQQRPNDQGAIDSEISRLVPASVSRRVELVRLLDDLGMDRLPHMYPKLRERLTGQGEEQQLGRTRAAAEAVAVVQRFAFFFPRYAAACAGQLPEATFFAMKETHGANLRTWVYEPVRRALTQEEVPGALSVSRFVGPVHFEDIQRQALKLLDQCAIDLGLRDRWGLQRGFSEVAKLIPPPEGTAGQASEAGDGATATATQPQRDPELEKLKDLIRQHIERASSLDVIPRKIIKELTQLLTELERVPRDETLPPHELMRKRYIALQWIQRLKDHEAMLHQEDPILSRLPAEVKLREMADELERGGKAFWQAVEQIAPVPAVETLSPATRAVIRELGSMLPDHFQALAAGTHVASASEHDLQLEDMRFALERGVEFDYQKRLLALLAPGAILSADKSPERKRRELDTCLAILQLQELGHRAGTLFAHTSPETVAIAAAPVLSDLAGAIAKRRIEDLAGDNMQRLLGNTERMVGCFRIWKPVGGVGAGVAFEGVYERAVSDLTLFNAYPTLTKLYQRRQRLINTVNNFEAKSILHPHPPGLRLADLCILGQPHFPEAVRRLLEVDACADQVLEQSLDGAVARVTIPPIAKGELFRDRRDLAGVPVLFADTDGLPCKRYHDGLFQVLVDGRRALNMAIYGPDAPAVSVAGGEPGEESQQPPPIVASGVVPTLGDWLPFQACLSAQLLRIVELTTQHAFKDCPDDFARSLKAAYPRIHELRKDEDLHKKEAEEKTKQWERASKELEDLKKDSSWSDNLPYSRARQLESEVPQKLAAMQKANRDLEAAKKDADEREREELERLQQRLMDDVTRAVEATKRIAVYVSTGRHSGVLLDGGTTAEEAFQSLSTATTPIHDASLLPQLKAEADGAIQAAEELLKKGVLPHSGLASRLNHLLLIIKVAQRTLLNLGPTAGMFAVRCREVAPITANFARKVSPHVKDMLSAASGLVAEAEKKTSDPELMIGLADSMRRTREEVVDVCTAVGLESKATAVLSHALTHLAQGVIGWAFRAAYVSLWLVQLRQLPGEDYAAYITRFREYLHGEGYGEILGLTESQADPELKSLKLQHVSVSTMLRGTFLYLAYGVALTPYEIARSLDRALASVDVALFPTVYLTHLLLTKGLAQVFAADSRGAALALIDQQSVAAAVGALRQLHNAVRRVSLASALGNQPGQQHRNAMNANTAFRLHEDRMALTAEVVKGLTSMDTAFSYLNAGDSVLVVSGVGPGNGALGGLQQKAGVFGAHLREFSAVLAREILSFTLVTTRDRLIRETASGARLIQRLQGPLLDTSGGVPRLMQDKVLLLDTLRLGELASSAGGFASLPNFYKDLRALVKVDGGAAHEALLQELEAYVALSSLMVVGMYDLAQASQLLVRCSFNPESTLAIVTQYREAARSALDALYTPLDQVGIDHATSQGSKVVVLQEVLEAERRFAQHVCQSIAERIVERCTASGGRVAHLEKAGAAVTQLCTRAQELQAALTELLERKYERRKASDDRLVEEAARKMAAIQAQNANRQEAYERSTQEQAALRRDIETNLLKTVASALAGLDIAANQRYIDRINRAIEGDRSLRGAWGRCFRDEFDEVETSVCYELDLARQKMGGFYFTRLKIGTLEISGFEAGMRVSFHIPISVFSGGGEVSAEVIIKHKKDTYVGAAWETAKSVFVASEPLRGSVTLRRSATSRSYSCNPRVIPLASSTSKTPRTGTGTMLPAERAWMRRKDPGGEALVTDADFKALLRELEEKAAQVRQPIAEPALTTLLDDANPDRIRRRLDTERAASRQSDESRLADPKKGRIGLVRRVEVILSDLRKEVAGSKLQEMLARLAEANTDAEFRETASAADKLRRQFSDFIDGSLSKLRKDFKEPGFVTDRRSVHRDEDLDDRSFDSTQATSQEIESGIKLVTNGLSLLRTDLEFAMCLELLVAETLALSAWVMTPPRKDMHNAARAFLSQLKSPAVLDKALSRYRSYRSKRQNTEPGESDASVSVFLKSLLASTEAILERRKETMDHLQKASERARSVKQSARIVETAKGIFRNVDAHQALSVVIQVLSAADGRLSFNVPAVLMNFGFIQQGPEHEERWLLIENTTQRTLQVCINKGVVPGTRGPLATDPDESLRLVPANVSKLLFTLRRGLQEGEHSWAFTLRADDEVPVGHASPELRGLVTATVQALAINTSPSLLDFGHLVFKTGKHIQTLTLENPTELEIRVKLASRLEDGHCAPVSLGRGDITLKPRSRAKVDVRLDSDQGRRVSGVLVLAVGGPKNITEIPFLGQLWYPTFALRPVPENSVVPVMPGAATEVISTVNPMPVFGEADRLAAVIKSGAAVYVGPVAVGPYSNGPEPRDIVISNKGASRLEVLVKPCLLHQNSLAVQPSDNGGSIFAEAGTDVRAKLNVMAKDTAAWGLSAGVEVTVGPSTVTIPVHGYLLPKRVEMPGIEPGGTSEATMMLVNHSRASLVFRFSPSDNYVAVVPEQGKLEGGAHCSITLRCSPKKKHLAASSTKLEPQVTCHFEGCDTYKLVCEVNVGVALLSARSKGLILDLNKLASSLDTHKRLPPFPLVVEIRNDGSIAADVWLSSQAGVAFADSSLSRVTIRPSDKVELELLVQVPRAAEGEHTLSFNTSSSSSPKLSCTYRVGIIGPHLQFCTQRGKKDAKKLESIELLDLGVVADKGSGIHFHVANFGREIRSKNITSDLRYGQAKLTVYSGLDPSTSLRLLNPRSPPYQLPVHVPSQTPPSGDEWQVPLDTALEGPLRAEISFVAENEWTFAADGTCEQGVIHSLLIVGHIPGPTAPVPVTPLSLSRLQLRFPQGRYLAECLALVDSTCGRPEVERSVGAALLVGSVSVPGAGRGGAPVGSTSDLAQLLAASVHSLSPALTDADVAKLPPDALAQMAGPAKVEALLALLPPTVRPNTLVADLGKALLAPGAADGQDTCRQFLSSELLKEKGDFSGPATVTCFSRFTAALQQTPLLTPAEVTVRALGGTSLAARQLRGLLDCLALVSSGSGSPERLWITLVNHAQDHGLALGIDELSLRATKLAAGHGQGREMVQFILVISKELNLTSDPLLSHLQKALAANVGALDLVSAAKEWLRIRADSSGSRSGDEEADAALYFLEEMVHSGEFAQSCPFIRYLEVLTRWEGLAFLNSNAARLLLWGKRETASAAAALLSFISFKLAPAIAVVAPLVASLQDASVLDPCLKAYAEATSDKALTLLPLLGGVVHGDGVAAKLEQLVSVINTPGAISYIVAAKALAKSCVELLQVLMGTLHEQEKVLLASRVKAFLVLLDSVAKETSSGAYSKREVLMASTTSVLQTLSEKPALLALLTSLSKQRVYTASEGVEALGAAHALVPQHAPFGAFVHLLQELLVEAPSPAVVVDHLFSSFQGSARISASTVSKLRGKVRAYVESFSEDEQPEHRLRAYTQQKLPGRTLTTFVGQASNLSASSPAREVIEQLVCLTRAVYKEGDSVAEAVEAVRALLHAACLGPLHTSGDTLQNNTAVFLATTSLLSFNHLDLLRPMTA